MSDPSGLQGGRIVVTGAASGIGRATALLLVERGVDVVAADRDEDGLAALAAAETIVCDVTDKGDRSRLVEAAGASCSGLVNAAGTIRLASLDTVEEDDWDAIMAVNAKALFFLCQAFVPRLRAGGAIVNVSSGAGKTGTTHEAAVYGASKAAVLSLTRSLAQANADRGVRVNAVCPGVIETPMNDVVVSRLSAIRRVEPGELQRRRVSAVPMGRAAAPEEVAAVIAFLLSSAASYMTGQALNVTGGQITY